MDWDDGWTSMDGWVDRGGWVIGNGCMAGMRMDGWPRNRLVVLG